MSLNDTKKRRRSSSSRLNLAFGTVGVFTLALSSSSSSYAEAKTQKHHRSFSGDDVVHGVGETQVRGSSSTSSSSSSSSLKRNAKEHHVPLAHATTIGENDHVASLGGKYEQRIQSKLGDVLVPPKAPAFVSVAGEGKLKSTTIESLSRDGDEERARDDRETDETMKKLDGYFNFDDNASNNKASEEKKSSASSLS